MVTLFSNRKMNTPFMDVDMVASSVSVAKKNADSSREVENVVFSGTALAVSVLFFAIVCVIKLYVVCMAIIGFIIIMQALIYKIINKQNVGLFLRG